MSIFSSYRADPLTREQMAASDPFGDGVFLSAPGMDCGAITRKLEQRLGKIVPAVAWNDLGAWVSPGSTGMSADQLRDLWDGGKASERG
jgi:hypothetical protein